MTYARSAVLFFAIFIAIAALPLMTHADDGCQQATAADVANLKANGVNDITVGGCLRDADRKVLNLNSSGTAKQDLQKMWCGGNAAQCTYQGTTYTSTIDGLDPKFAVCADRFMQQLRQKDSSACIRSAYRSTAHQICACGGNANGVAGKCAPAGRSYHQKGLAIDVNHRLQNNQFWQLAGMSGLGNPTGLHVSDPDHIQVMNGGTNCADVGYSPTDTDVFTPGPASSNPYFNYGPSPMTAMAPISAMTSAAIGSAAATPTATPTASTNTTSGSGSSQICTPQFSCTGGTMYYQTSTCTTQTYQVCAYGCNGNSCAAATSSTSTGVGGAFTSTSTASSSNSNTNSNSDSSSSPTPVSDILSQLTGYTFSAVDIATSSSLAFQLDPSTGDVAHIGGTSLNQTTAVASGTIYSVQPTIAQQTFTSGDLSGSSTVYPQSSQVSGLQSILSGMRSALTWALNVLKTL